MLFDTKLFLIGNEPFKYSVYIYKLTFYSTLVDLAIKIPNSYPYFIDDIKGDFIVSVDNSKIYTFFEYKGNSGINLCFVIMSSSTGNFESKRYKSGIIGRGNISNSKRIKISGLI